MRSYVRNMPIVYMPSCFTHRLIALRPRLLLGTESVSYISPKLMSAFIMRVMLVGLISVSLTISVRLTG